MDRVGLVLAATSAAMFTDTWSRIILDWIADAKTTMQMQVKACWRFFEPSTDHPLLEEKYTGVETTRLWNKFVCSYLAETKRKFWVVAIVYC